MFGNQSFSCGNENQTPEEGRIMNDFYLNNSDSNSIGSEETKGDSGVESDIHVRTPEMESRLPKDVKEVESDFSSEEDVDETDHMSFKVKLKEEQPEHPWYDEDYDEDGNDDAMKGSSMKSMGEKSIHLVLPQSPPIPTAGEHEGCGETGRNFATPLVAIPTSTMTPSEHAASGSDFKSVFPSIKPDTVLRFSRLLDIRTRSVNTWTPAKRLFRATPEENRSCWRFGHKVPPTSPNSDDKMQVEVMRAYEEIGNLFKPSESEMNRRRDGREGPAKLWYDMLDNKEFPNYGFKVKPQLNSNTERDPNDFSQSSRQGGGEAEFPEGMFTLASQVEWENDVIWDTGDTEQVNNCVPIPTPVNIPGSGFQMVSVPSKCVHNWDGCNGQLDWGTSLPFENTELVDGSWEKDIIWDAEQVNKNISPKKLTLDPNDDHIILSIPPDNPFQGQNSVATATEASTKPKLTYPHAKTSLRLLAKVGLSSNVLKLEEEDEDISPTIVVKNDKWKDPYNISNDQYYQPKSMADENKTTALLLRHSIPVLELQPPFIDSKMLNNAEKLRNFHRPPWKLSSSNNSKKTPFLPLTQHIKNKAEERRVAEAEFGSIFFMHNAIDLSGRDGELLLIEYSEEYPPLLSQVGMCSSIRNYYRRTNRDFTLPSIEYGETTVVPDPSPFLGNFHPGQVLSSLENNMYRAPIYPHKVPGSDFLVILDKKNVNRFNFIREIDGLFTAGQECPLIEVPAPNSRRAEEFLKNFLLCFIYRLFSQSSHNPPQILLKDVLQAFPIRGEASIRKRLGTCAVYMKACSKGSIWVLKPDFRLPTEDEIRDILSPEECCANLSLLAALQRFEDAGYYFSGQQKLVPLMITSSGDEDEDVAQEDLCDEVNVAPWNTTAAYIRAVKGKCLLQLLSSSADPTGCGEGFSYVRAPTRQKPKKWEERQENRVSGTDADLRRLTVAGAKEKLRKSGLTDKEIAKLNRWQMIDLVRTISNEKMAEPGCSLIKFNRYLPKASMHEFRKECQRLFDLQNKVLSSTEVLDDTDDEGESEEDEELKQMAKEIEEKLLNYDEEEEERIKLLKMIHDDDDEQRHKELEPVEEELMSTAKKVRVLKITRTHINPDDGKEYSETEIVRDPAVISRYQKEKQEELKRMTKRLKDQLRRLNKKEKVDMNNMKKAENEIVSKPPPPQQRTLRKPQKKPRGKVQCGRCHEIGHMMTNKACPLFYKKLAQPHPNLQSAKPSVDAGKKLEVKMNGSIMKIAGLKRSSSVLEVPKKSMGKGQKRRKLVTAAGAPQQASSASEQYIIINYNVGKKKKGSIKHSSTSGPRKLLKGNRDRLSREN